MWCIYFTLGMMGDIGCKCFSWLTQPLSVTWRLKLKENFLNILALKFAWLFCKVLIYMYMLVFHPPCHKSESQGHRLQILVAGKHISTGELSFQAFRFVCTHPFSVLLTSRTDPGNSLFYKTEFSKPCTFLFQVTWDAGQAPVSKYRIKLTLNDLGYSLI